jgi:DNA-binding NarL/FixJ family response regulator
MKVPVPKASASSNPPLSPATGARIRILLVDDHPLLRIGMRMIIEEKSKFEVCAEAESAPEAVALAQRLTPDLAIIDITLKSANGIELTKALRAQQPQLRILVVSMHDEEVYAERALRAGAMGYLMKLEAGEKLITALQHIIGGEIYVSERLKDRMLRSFLNQSAEKAVSLVGTLSDRELEVLDLIGNGYSTRAIAGQLGLSAKTIDSYREHLKVKLKLKNSGELVRYAVQWTKSEAQA